MLFSMMLTAQGQAPLIAWPTPSKIILAQFKFLGPDVGRLYGRVIATDHAGLLAYPGKVLGVLFAGLALAKLAHTSSKSC
jgi:hypothetical protein